MLKLSANYGHSCWSAMKTISKLLNYDYCFLLFFPQMKYIKYSDRLYSVCKPISSLSSYPNLISSRDVIIGRFFVCIFRCCIGSRLALSGVTCVYGPTVRELRLADTHTGKNIHKFGKAVFVVCLFIKGSQ